MRQSLNVTIVVRIDDDPARISRLNEAVCKFNKVRTIVLTCFDNSLEQRDCVNLSTGMDENALYSSDIIICMHHEQIIHNLVSRLVIRPSIFEFIEPINWGLIYEAAQRVIDDRAATSSSSPFSSFIQGGFECSTHRRAEDGVRLDMIAASRHDKYALHDLMMLSGHGIKTVREGLRWHLVEHTAGSYEWSSAEQQIASAVKTGTQVIWDLMHYGWPDYLDVWSDDFPMAFGNFAAAAARILKSRLTEPRWYSPVNEISFLSWAGAEVGAMNPSERGRGSEFKRQLVRCAVAAAKAIKREDPSCRFVQPEPLIHVASNSDIAIDQASAASYRRSQFEAWNMISGRQNSELGGSLDLIDIIGVNFYVHNQWIYGGGSLTQDDPLYIPLQDLLVEVHARYGRPILISETGIEGEARCQWLRGIISEVAHAISRGTPVLGICLYPILDHPGWLDGRYCNNGLLTNGDKICSRVVYKPLATVIDDFILHSNTI